MAHRDGLGSGTPRVSPVNLGSIRRVHSPLFRCAPRIPKDGPSAEGFWLNPRVGARAGKPPRIRPVSPCSADQRRSPTPLIVDVPPGFAGVPPHPHPPALTTALSCLCASCRVSPLGLESHLSSHFLDAGGTRPNSGSSSKILVSSPHCSTSWHCPFPSLLSRTPRSGVVTSALCLREGEDFVR
ncbi:hypothetical protein VUR80DRAFT_7385 [Thermomyces stellatus]